MPGETGTTHGKAERALSTSVVQAGQSMCDGQPKEYFWGCSLTTASSTVTWSTDDEENDEDFLHHTLFLRHAILGSSASSDRHVVEVETKDHHGETLKMPIFCLKMGLNEMVNLDLNFPNGIPVTIRLIEGSGPVHITGQQLLEFPDEENLDDTEAMTEEDEAEEEEDEVDEEEEDVEEEDEEEEEEKKKSTAKAATKRKASVTKGSKKAKKGRRDRSGSDNGSDEDEEDEDEEEEEDPEESMEDDEEDEDYEEEEKKSSKKAAAKPKGKGARVVKKKEKPVAKKGKKAKA